MFDASEEVTECPECGAYVALVKNHTYKECQACGETRPASQITEKYNEIMVRVDLKDLWIDDEKLMGKVDVDGVIQECVLIDTSVLIHGTKYPKELLPGIVFNWKEKIAIDFVAARLEFTTIKDGVSMHYNYEEGISPKGAGGLIMYGEPDFDGKVADLFHRLVRYEMEREK